jgi:hypothetical protein
VVRRLLRQLGYSLQANAKVSEGSRQHPDGDAQFAYLNDQAAAHLAAGNPVTSVDAKKKENVGEFKNGGREWQPKGSREPVNVHDFIDKELGKVTPYGIYDVAANAGWFRWAPTTTPPRSPWRPLPAGGGPSASPPTGRDPAAELRRRWPVERLPRNGAWCRLPPSDDVGQRRQLAVARRAPQPYGLTIFQVSA